MQYTDKIYVAGHLGLVGSAIVRKLRDEGYTNLVYRSIDELDLTNQVTVNEFFERERPEYVFDAAARVGGIHANRTYPAEFLYQNLMIQNNLIHAAYRHGVNKFLFLGSSCIYPKFAPQPIKEESLLGGALEPTNEWYAIAKIAGVKMGQAYRRQYGFNVISLMPTNLYGPGDNFDLETSHVLPALIRRFHEAKEAAAASVTVWGTGTVRREFLYVDDLADAVNINATHKKEHNRAEDAWRLYGFFPWIHRIRFRRSLLGSGRDLWKVGGDKYLRMVSRERVGGVGDIAPFLGCLVSAEHT